MMTGGGIEYVAVAFTERYRQALLCKRRFSSMVKMKVARQLTTSPK
jgi:hypothetical protein